MTHAEDTREIKWKSELYALISEKPFSVPQKAVVLEYVRSQKAVWEKAERERIKKIVKERIAYGKKYRLHRFDSGWSGIESGPCCNKCRINKKAVAESGHAVALRLTVGCKDPFQINCKCHISYRKVAEESIQEALKNILRLRELQ